MNTIEKNEIRVGIVTTYGETNYGNKLQNYALKKVLNNYGCKVDTIIRAGGLSKKIKNIAIQMPKINRVLLYRKMSSIKREKIAPFSKKYLSTRLIKGDLTTLNANYDSYITGSDQVWNPNFAATDMHFLSFAPPEKRFSYAASFGISKIPKNQTSYFANHLSKLEQISVREEDGARIVKELTGQDAVVVLDPTLLLSGEKWDDLINANKIKPIKDDYIFLYFLHQPNQTLKKKIDDFAKKHNYKIYHVMGDTYDKTHQTPTVPEFLARIRHAKMVFTDSFHGTIFSIIFHVPFAVFNRQDAKMSSRINTLLKTAGLSSNAATDKSDFDKLLTTNFLNVNQKIAKERRKSLDFLRGVISNGK